LETVINNFPSAEELKAWRLANPEKVKAQNKRAYARLSLEQRKRYNENRKAKHKQNPEVNRARDKARYKAHPERKRTAALRALLKSVGASVSVLEARPKYCQICGSGKKICFDHCHASLKFRGWLCNKCNTALGFAGDSPEILRKLADYLEAHHGQTDCKAA